MNLSIAQDLHLPAYAAAFVAGIAGSLHCFAMCGGLAGALGMRARQNGASPAKRRLHAVMAQAGRLLSYTGAGALFGAFGNWFAQTGLSAPLLVFMRVAAGLLLMALALKILFQWNLLHWLERMGGFFWRLIAPLTRRVGGNGLRHTLLLGALWGWLPCGLVYSMLLFAGFSGDAWQGAGILLAFGMGTVPAMLASSLFAAHLPRLVPGHRLRFSAGVLLLLFGIWTAVAPLTHANHEPDHSHHDHAT